MLVTPLTKALGIEHPVVQGGMMWVGEVGLCAAVSEAGGLGILTGLTSGTPENLRRDIGLVRERTKKPFAVNLSFLPSISPPPYEEYAKVVIEEGVKIVETAGGPAANPIQMYKKAGIYVIHKCTSIRHAKSAVKFGADCLSIDGFECAGHPGEDDTGALILLALAAKELDVPFIASGGIANGRGLAAALALGAVGVNCGTLFMASTESKIHPKIKQKMIDSGERDTIHMFRTLHNTARVFKNKVSMEVVALERRPGGVTFPEIAHLVAGSRGRTVYETGDPDAGIWSAGPCMSLLTKVEPCKDIIRNMVQEAEDVLNTATSYIVTPSKL